MAVVKGKKSGTDKKASGKAVKAPDEAASTEPVEVSKRVIQLTHDGDTRNFSKFVVDKEANPGVVGSIYAPPGTVSVRVLIEEPAE